MKLSAIYSNFEYIFPRITFHEGVNVIFGQVKEENLAKDSHNLGKTFLITVIDFCLLTTVDKGHPFKSNNDLFKDFEFYLEIETNEGRYVTIKRSVNNPTQIYINATQKNRNANFISLSESEWTHSSLTLKKAIGILDELLGLSDIRPFPFRKGLSHIMRRQNDYSDEFRTSKFTSGRDLYWKPYIFKILGFDEEVLNKKYNVDSAIEKSRGTLEIYESDAGFRSEEYDELMGLIEVGESKLDAMKVESNRFDFRELNSEVTAEMVNNVERELSKLNEARYRSEAAIRDIEASLSNSFSFDLGRLERLFAESHIAFEGRLKRSYEELVEFNIRLSFARNQQLKEQLHVETDKKQMADALISKLTKEREALVAALIETQAFEKFKLSQERIIEKEREIASLRAKLENLDKAGSTVKEIAVLQKERINEIDNVTAEVKKVNPLYKFIRRKFSELSESVLDTSAILSVNINSEGNPEFKVITVDNKRETNEGKGTSYKKILCACFDLAVASAHANTSYYRYIYHDGIFEGLDNRKKIKLLNNIRSICKEDSIQYILTIIDTDLPRDTEDQKLLFEPSEIVRYLDDTGQDGRLFKMPKF